MSSEPVWPAVRALHDAFTVPGAASPYDVVQLRVAYPAAATVDDPEQGVVGSDRSRGPLPVVVLSGNFNCEPHHYYWLARRLALAGHAVVTYSWVAPMFGGRPGLTTGVDLEAVASGGRPTRLLDPLLAKLAELAAGRDLGGALDLDRVLLGGHSAGGSLALLAASGPWWPAVRGAFSYGGHTRAQRPQGLGDDTYLPLPGTTPLLLMGGTADGVVDAVARAQLGHVPDGQPMRRTFDEAVPPGRPAWLLLVEGADHYAVAEGYDATTGRGYLEAPGPAAPAGVRTTVGELVVDFAAYVLRGDSAAADRLTAGVTAARR